MASFLPFALFAAVTITPDQHVNGTMLSASSIYQTVEILHSLDHAEQVCCDRHAGISLPIRICLLQCMQHQYDAGP